MYPSILAPGNTQPYSSGPLEQSCLPHPQPHAPGHPSAFGAYQQQQDYPPMQQQQAMQHQQYPSGPQLVSEQHQLYPLSAPQQRHSSNGSCPYPALQQQPQQQMNGVSAYPSVAQQQQAPYPYPSQDLNNGLQQQQTLQRYNSNPYSQQQQQQLYPQQQQQQLYPELRQQQQTLQRYNSNPYSQQQQQQLYPQQQQQELYPELRQQQQTLQRYNSNLDPQQQQQQQYPQQQQQQQQQEQLAYPMLHTQSCPLDQTQMQQQQQSLYPQLPRQQTAPQQSIYPSLDRQSTPQQQQQQQRREPLPPYPKLPPSLTFKASPDSVCNGYDVLVYINQATKLPGMDWWNGKADPYVIITTSAAGAEQQLEYRTQTIPASLNPKFDEFFELGNLPPGATLVVEVWDKDTFTEDDIIGRACWTFAPVEMLKCASAGGGMLGGDDSWGRIPVSIKLAHPVKKKQSKGTLEIEVCYRPSIQPGKPTMMGPVKFRQHLSPTAGALTGHWGDADTMSFSTYKLYLMHIESTFKGIRCPWNKKYDKAKTIFTNPVVLSMVCTQHNSLYATRMGATRCGVLENSQQFFELFKGGQRGGQRRYFTYTLLEDSFRCSETGAAFFSDMMSKHAMHAGGAEEVLFAGEFCIVPDGSAPGGHRLIIDNNSGTYAPDTEYLPLMKQLFKSNFKDMVVEVLPVGDPKLKMYQQQCPSRSGV